MPHSGSSSQPSPLQFSPIPSQRPEDGGFVEIRRLIHLTREEIKMMQRKIDQTEERLKIVEEIQGWLDANYGEPMEYTMDDE